MTIRLSSLSKLETPSASVQTEHGDAAERVVILLKLHEGANRPNYVEIRTRFSDSLYSAELRREELSRLEKDPSVESFSLARALPLIP